MRTGKWLESSAAGRCLAAGWTVNAQVVRKYVLEPVQARSHYFVSIRSRYQHHHRTPALALLPTALALLPTALSLLTTNLFLLPSALSCYRRLLAALGLLPTTLVLLPTPFVVLPTALDSLPTAVALLALDLPSLPTSPSRNTGYKRASEGTTGHFASATLKRQLTNTLVVIGTYATSTITGVHS